MWTPRDLAYLLYALGTVVVFAGLVIDWYFGR